MNETETHDQLTSELNPGLTGLELAVIGMAGKFPGAGDIHEFWNNLINGVESVIDVTEEELEKMGVDESIRDNPNYVRKKVSFEKKEYFDAYFFDYTPIEGELLSPQIRLFMECTWSALEDAGYDPFAYPGKVGIYAGASSSPNWQNLVNFTGKGRDSGSISAAMLSNKDFMSTIVSYKLNLKGPSVNFSTACSTSLVALHFACQDLLNGQCDMAVAGGVKVSALNAAGYFYQEGMIYSSDGHCKAFDADADGAIFGEGGGAVVLKMLEDAMADGDHIYAIVKGSAINNDGSRKVGLTAPSIDGQVDVIRAAQHMAGVSPDTIGFVEAHGTGTAIGDPIEMEALTMAFDSQKRNYCAVGSVKTNIGHLDAAAGVTGFIKTVLALKHKQIPPSLNFKKPNPKIDFVNSPFYVNTRPSPWKTGTAPLRAAVSSFGIGGTNVHVILEEAPPVQTEANAAHENKYRLLLWSAKTPTALDKMNENMAGFLRDNPGVNMDDVAYTLATGRHPFPFRRMMVCRTPGEAAAALTDTDSAKVRTAAVREDKNRVVFMFSGQGSQYVNMASGLYRSEPVFRETLDQCGEILKPMLGFDIRDVLYTRGDPEEAAGKLNHVLYSGPIKFSVEYSLAKMLIGWGIQPDAMIGHSFGEYAVACLAGVFSPEDALSMAVLRGQLMERTAPGGMMSVPLSGEEIQPYLGDKVALAAVNSSFNCIVSGDKDALSQLEKRLDDEGHECVVLNFPRASHSALMDPILEEFEQAFAKITLNTPRVPYISGVTGNWITVSDATDPAYWSRHMRRTVRFSDGAGRLLEEENQTIILMGADKGLPLFVNQHPRFQSSHMVLNILRHSKDDVTDRYYLLQKLGEMWLRGIPADWNRFYQNENHSRISLPTYPYERIRLWIDDQLLGDSGKSAGNSLFAKKTDMADWFYIPSWTTSPLPPTIPGKDSDPGPVMLLAHPGGFASRLAAQLREQVTDLIVLEAGDRFEKADRYSYIIRPREAEDYEAVMRELHLQDRMPRRILHMFGMTGDSRDGMEPGALLADREHGFYSLLHLSKSIGNRSFNDDVRIIAITRKSLRVTGTDEVRPGRAMVLGPVKVIPQEYGNIRCRCIDIQSPEPGGPPEPESAAQLISELFSGSHELITAYRGGLRWVQSYQPYRLEEELESQPVFSRDGVYLITGGLGGVGFLIAKRLAKEFNARLVLTGRTPLPPRQEWEKFLNSHQTDHPVSQKIRKILKLEETGARVLALTADSADYPAMEQAVEDAYARFGDINGVIHAAGVIDARSFKPIQEIQRSDCELQFRPKVDGLDVLARLFQNREPRFCLLMSSIACVLGGLGYVAYTASNIFMDAFSYRRNLSGKGNTRWIAVNWDGWQYDEEDRQRKTMGKTLEKLSMTPDEGMSAVKRVLACNLPQVVHSIGDLQERIDRWINLDAGDDHQDNNSVEAFDDASSLFPRPALPNSFEAPRNKREMDMAAIWQRLFGYREVGIEDDFFRLGGDSLKAMTLTANIHKELGVRVSIKDIFANPTIKELVQITGRAGESSFSSIRPAELKEYYRLSSAQERLFVHQQLDKNSIAYNQPKVVVLNDQVDPERLEDTLNRLIARHESFRTSVGIIHNKPVQRIHPAHKVKLSVQYIQATADQLDDVMDEFVRPFDLARPPFLRAGLIKIDENRHVFIVDMHHIVTDGLSHQVFINEFHALYAGDTLPPLKLQYKDYAEWQNREKVDGSLKEQEEFWLEQFNGKIPLLELPCDFQRPAVQDFQGDRVNFKIDSSSLEALKALAAREDVTIFMILLSLFNVLLAKLSGQEDIIIGIPSAGRSHADLEKIIGMFVNTLALRNFPNSGKTFRQFLLEVKERTLKAFENQDYQFEDIVENVVVHRNPGRNPLFDVMFVLQNLDLFKAGGGSTGSLDDSGDESEDPGDEIQYQYKTSKFDLTLMGAELNNNLVFTLHYSVKLFKRETVERFAAYFRKIVSAVIDNIDIPISQVEIMDDEEKQSLLNRFREDTGKSFINKAVSTPVEDKKIEVDFDF